MVKYFYLTAAIAICFAAAENAAATSSLNEVAGQPLSETLYEKPKPGSKRWQRRQKHVRNTRRKKYPRMRRGGQAEWSRYTAGQSKDSSDTKYVAG